MSALLQIAESGIVLPSLVERSNSPFSGHSPFLIDASTEKVAFIFRAARTGTITAFGMRFGEITTGDDLKFSVQGVSVTTGFPDGIINGSASIETIGTGQANTWFESVTTSLAASITKGNIYSLVIEFNAFVAGNLEIDYQVSLQGSQALTLPYAAHDTGTWAKPPTGRGFICVALNWDGIYHADLGFFPILTADGQEVIQLTGSPDEVGLRFRVPMEMRMLGMSAGFRTDNNNSEVSFWDSDESLIEAITIDKDIAAQTNALNPFYLILATPFNLKPNVFYRVTIKPLSGQHRLSTLVADSVNEMSILELGGDFLWTERTDAGAWTDSDVKRPGALGIIVDRFHDGQGIVSHRANTLARM